MKTFNPGQPIETPDGLHEAVLDTIRDNYRDGERPTTGYELQRQLPYGQRVRNSCDHLIRCGLIERVARGAYRPR